MPRVWEVPVHDSTRVRDARVAAEAAAARAGLDEARNAGCALVATELATNLLKHAGGGLILLDVVSRPEVPRADVCRPGVSRPDPGRADGAVPLVQIVAIDHGPGLRDVAGALRDGFSTTSSLGAGLGTCRRVADDFDLHSTVGRGTIALARLGARPVRRAGRSCPAPAVRAGGVNVPFAGAEFSGDAWAWVRAGDLTTLMLADGLGHGPAAARASSAAVEQLYRAPELPPAQLLRRLEGALRDTRGAAVAVAQLDPAGGRLLFSGVGNIGARLRTGARWQPLLSRPGIVGAHRAARIPEHEVAWRDDCLLVLHSDGLPSRWSPGPAAHSPSLDPAVIAAVIVRDASSPARPVRDDTTVAVLSPSSPEHQP